MSESTATIPTCDCDPTIGAINGLKSVNGQRSGKAFEALRAAFALCGHTLQRTHPADRLVTYFVEPWGLMRYLSTLRDLALFLAQIWGMV